jgi:hypothetical protein
MSPQAARLDGKPKLKRENTMTTTALVGKYFIGVHGGSMRSGIIEAAINDSFYLVRFDELVGFTDGSKWPEAMAVAALSDMVMAGTADDDKPPPWCFFDTADQRAKYDAWGIEPTPDRKPRIVPLRPLVDSNPER